MSAATGAAINHVKENTMNISTPTTFGPRPATTRRVARAVLLAGALTLAASAFGQSATAGAEWDIEKYDRCMYIAYTKPIYCCIDSGGRMGSDGVCRAPWNESVNASQIFQPNKNPTLPTAGVGTPAT
jgi:hypothetical protein